MSVEIEFLSRICPKDGGRHQVGVVRVYTEEVRGTPRRERACYKCGLRDTFIQEVYRYKDGRTIPIVPKGRSI